MSFLDNLENNLKALESREEGGADNAVRREAAKHEARASAPWAERLKKDPWTQSLLQQVTRAGFQRRLKVSPAWIGTSLRLESLGHRLELRPSPDGINAVFGRNGEDLKSGIVDLAADPGALVNQWMAILDVQRKLNEEESRRLAESVEAQDTE